MIHAIIYILIAIFIVWLVNKLQASYKEAARLLRYDAMMEAYKSIEQSYEWEESEKFFKAGNKYPEQYYNLRCMLKRKIVSGI